jgi:hypothetical protein
MRLCGLVPPMEVCERRAQACVDGGNARREARGFDEGPHGILVAAETHQLQPFVIVGRRAFRRPEVRTGSLITGLECRLPVSRDAAEQGLVGVGNALSGA